MYKAFDAELGARIDAASGELFSTHLSAVAPEIVEAVKGLSQKISGDIAASAVTITSSLESLQNRVSSLEVSISESDSRRAHLAIDSLLTHHGADIPEELRTALAQHTSTSVPNVAAIQSAPLDKKHATTAL